MNNWMDGRTTFLCWATSSLSVVFAEQPLIWATSALSCLPATLLKLLLRAAVTLRLATSSCNPACQGSIPRCSERASFLRFISCTILPTSSSKSAPNVTIFSTVWSTNWALATVLYPFCPQLSHSEARTRGNRDPTSATPRATLPKKTQGFRPDSVFTREFTRSGTVTLLYTASTCELLLFIMLLRWWWHDDQTGPGHSSVTRKFSNYTSSDKYWNTHTYIYLSTYLSIYRSIHLSIYLPIYLSIYIYIDL